MPTLLDNRRARFRFRILEMWEVGLVLTGQEVKSLRSGQGDLSHAYVTVRARPRPGHERPRLEAWLVNAYIPPYTKAGPLAGYDPRRARRLLFHRRELAALIGHQQVGGLTLVPLSVYTQHRHLKARVGLVRGKTTVDKRETIRRREVDRETRRATLRRQ